MKIRDVVIFLLLSVLLCTGALVQAAQQGEIEPSGVTFDFVDVDIAAVAKFVSDITGKNLIFDERVRGKITIIAPSKLSVDDAFSLFTSVLRLKGFAVTSVGVDAYKIIPIKEARQSGLTVTTGRVPVDESYIARLIQLRNISSDEALKLIQPIVSSDGYISSFGPGNLLLVVDSGLNVNKILNIMDVIDRQQAAQEPEVVLLKHGKAETIAAVLNEGGARQPKKGSGAIAAKAVADKRLNAVVLFGNKADRDAMKRLLTLLDVPTEQAQSTINVYFLENADAEELARVLEKLTARKAPTRDPGKAKSPFNAIADMTITPDVATNSLIVVAPPTDFQNLLRVIKKLDRRRRQVYVEAMIIEASIDRLRQLGSRWRAIARSGGEPVVIGGVGTIDASAIETIISGLSGLTAGGLGNFLTVPVTQADGTQANITIPGYAALFSLSEFKNVVDVLSTPQILTSDNEEAEIVVGENVPFIGTQERDITTTNTVLSSIERTDVGITLRIKPHITEGHFVKLDIYQEISAVKDMPSGVDSTQILTTVGPTTIKRATRTSVSVKNGQTVVIGGLMQERQEKTISKVPVLGDIPLLGLLFKHKKISRQKTNLLVFLTPRIVDDEGLLAITDTKKDVFARESGKFVEGECLVKFRGDVSEERALELIADRGAGVKEYFEGLNLYHLTIREGVDVEKAIKEFQKYPEVEYAEPNYRLELDEGPRRAVAD